MRVRRGQLVRLAPLLLAAFPAGATVQVFLDTSAHSPQPLATPIALSVYVSDTNPGAHDYRFVVALKGVNQNYIDFNLGNTFTWVPARTEGTYTISVAARNTTTGETGQVSENFVITPVLAKGLSAVHPTDNPLIALFSAPACAAGNTMLVRFQQVGSGTSQTTDARPCAPPASMNWYVAGMYANSQYQMHYETYHAGALVRVGGTLPFTTGSLPGAINFPANTVVTPASAPNSTLYPILLHAYLPRHEVGIVTPVATDLNGNVIWYLPYAVSTLTRTLPGGDMYVIYSGNPDSHGDLVREIDLAGNIVKETNASRMSEQLPYAGRPVNSLHHEARMLPNGMVAVFGDDEMLSTTAQGGTAAKAVDIIGDVVLILDPNFQVVWTWDAFLHLDISRTAPLGEVCTQGQSGCPEINLRPVANDWLHGNSIQETADGGLLLSLRHQDWVIKVDYANGAGSGNVLWRMGAGGDFTMNSTDPFPWFSHQHDAGFQENGETVLAMYDNGNTRILRSQPGGHSRGYVLSVDEANLQVTPTLLADMGAFSVGLGSAQLFPNGNYHFESGQIAVLLTGESVEVTPGAATAYEMTENNETYRSFRMQSLYIPATP